MGGAVDHAALVAALRALQGVADAGIEPDAAGGLGTLRLDLAPGADEAGVRGAVSRVLSEQFGLGVSQDVLGVLHAPDPVPEPPVQTPLGGVRPSIVRTHLVSAGLDVTASVTLASAARTATGEAKGLATPNGVHRAVSSATLRAVEELAGGQARFELEHLEITMMGPVRTVVVLLTLLTERGSEPLTGAAAVRDDIRQAVVRATLDALNRRLELLLTEV